ncbi:MAG: pantetheine-phosphate adenylyltransferase [Planctomycetota bacterium]|nr:pantetheine-phosphate adenylyltransferase [Planctomycetota bacterium]MEC7680994.1 pantetheine-phosphate adenylyltransferase [Planctomycetota bacterium]
MSEVLPDSGSSTPTRTAVYTGSFDPVTLGHLHIIERASPLFDQLVIGIGINADKRSLFEPEQRVDLVRRVTGHLDNVQVSVFHGLAVDFVRSIGARVMVRGIRPLTDIAGEFTMMMANQQLDAEIETVFLMAAEQYSHVSSSLLKQIATLSDDEDQLAKFVPKQIITPLRERLRAVAH